MGSYRISEVAARTGFPTSTLRFYEQVGVIAPTERSRAGYRLYDDRTIERLQFIGRAKQLGLSLDEITELAELWDSDACAPVQDRLTNIVDQKARQVAEQIAELTEFAAQLEQVRTRLTTVALDGPCTASCGCGPVEPVALGRRTQGAA